MIQITEKEKCCGCTACYNACPTHCIEMKADEEGFLYPFVNQEKCINCGKCEKVCPIQKDVVLNTEKVSAYIVQNHDSNVLSESTSGGFIDSLNQYIVGNGGYAAGVVYSEKWMPTHVITNDINKISAFRGSKYAQSEMTDIYSKIKLKLDEGEQVIFSGTPCQVAGLSTFLQKKYDNLYLVDLVCRSIPSAKLWKEYLLYQSQKYKSRIKNINCRNKTYGYYSGSLIIDFENGKRYSGSNRVDYYMKSFHHDICSRPSCYSCKFKTLERCSDFTVFDCWNPQGVALSPINDNNKGFSNVIVRTDKGKKLINKLNCVNIFPASDSEMYRYTGGMETNSIKRSEKRNTFYLMLNKYGFEKTTKMMIGVSKKDRFIEKMKPIKYSLLKVINRA